jgi:hypothetical protein
VSVAEKDMESRKDIEKKNLWKKVLAAAALLVIYACVVFSFPSERLAWQGPYVMGTLLLPKPSPSPYVRSVTMTENADSSFSLLGFLSATGILVLAIRKIPDFPPARRALRLNHALRVSIEEKIRIMYIL